MTELEYNPDGSPKVPHVKNPTTPDDVASLAALMKEFRAEVAQFRQEQAAQAELLAKINRPRNTAKVEETEADRAAVRLADISEHEWYCPGCGRLADYQQRCNGEDSTYGHPAIEMVRTEELGGDPAHHTPAPAAKPDSVIVVG